MKEQSREDFCFCVLSGVINVTKYYFQRYNDSFQSTPTRSICTLTQFTLKDMLVLYTFSQLISLLYKNDYFMRVATKSAKANQHFTTSCFQLCFLYVWCAFHFMLFSSLLVLFLTATTRRCHWVRTDMPGKRRHRMSRRNMILKTFWERKCAFTSSKIWFCGRFD